MASILLSGPAGSGKSQRARELLANATTPTIAADFTALFNALRLVERLPSGTFPVRTVVENVYLPVAESMRLEVIRQARRRGFDIVGTNSDGSPPRRRRLLEAMGPDAREVIVDPGREIVTARLSDTVTGSLAPECQAAIGRWYERLV